MKILLVDDEPFALKELKKCVAQLRPNAELFPFEYSDEALAFAKNEKGIDVAILDVNMPNMDGIELAKKLKNIYPLVNVIFCTAYEKYTMDAIRLHVSGYVNKPYEKADIARELDNLLHPVTSELSRVFARTFGDFDLFVEGAAVLFKRAKSKELLAYLIYKKGGMVSKKELAAVLFEDDYSAKTQNYIAKIYGDLVKDLETVGARSILRKGFNQYGVDVRLFACDYYLYDQGDPQAINAYMGEFMSQYDWGVL